MRNSVLIMGLIMVTELTGIAEDYPRAEIFAGLSYVSRETGFLGPFPGQRRENNGGLQGGVSFNASKKFGFCVDLGAQTIGFGTEGIQVLFGPRFMKRGQRATPFAHVLIGALIERKTPFSVFGPPQPTVTDTGFAMAFGSGLDVALGKRLALRVIQFDYLPSRLRGFREDNLRLGFGLTVKLGRRR